MQQALQQIIDDSKKLHSTPMGIMVTEFFEKRLKALGDGWIPVTERLPEERGTYIVYDLDTIYTCNFDDNNRFVIYEGGFEFFQKVTHWQPLPLIPNE